jgi:hypothetical protein
MGKFHMNLVQGRRRRRGSPRRLGCQPHRWTRGSHRPAAPGRSRPRRPCSGGVGGPAPGMMQPQISRPSMPNMSADQMGYPQVVRKC